MRSGPLGQWIGLGDLDPEQEVGRNEQAGEGDLEAGVEITQALGGRAGRLNTQPRLLVAEGTAQELPAEPTAEDFARHARGEGAPPQPPADPTGGWGA